MTLLHAGYLGAGLGAAAIPILIHFLFRRRRPPIDWAAMDILLAALRRQERRLRLEQLLLLAARCLLFAVAGLALARPILEGGSLLGDGSGRVVTVVLDDGVVSRGRASAGLGAASDFDGLKRRTAAFVRGLGAGDTVGLVLASRPARGLVLPPTSDRDAVARAIEGLEPTQAATDLAAALAVVGEVVGASPAADHVVLVASDLRLGALDPTSPSPAPWTQSGGRAPRLLALPPARDDRPDVAVAAIEAQRAVDDDSIAVTVRLDRAGGANAAESVRLAVEGDGTSPVPAKTVRFEAGQATARVEFALRASNDAERVGSGRIVARVDGDAMPADDERYAVFDARGATRVGVVARRSFGSGAEIEQVPAARWIARALQPIDQPGRDVSEIDPMALDARSLKDLDAVILPRPELVDPAFWQELRRFVDRGGFLLVMPSADVAAQRWVDQFTTAMGTSWQIAAEAPALGTPLTFAAEQPRRDGPQATFASIDAELPELLRPVEVSRRVEVRGTSGGDVVLALADGTPFLLVAPPGQPESSHRAEAPAPRGLVALLTVAPELAWTNLPVKPFMVPFLQELVRRSLARIGGAERAIVGDRPYVAARDAHELAGPDGHRVALDASGLAAASVSAAGAWSVLDQAGRVVGGVPVNVDPNATRMTPQSPELVAGWFAPLGPMTFGAEDELLGRLAPSKDANGAALWLLAALLAIAVVETAMARWFSHAANASGSRADGGVTSSALRAEDENDADAVTAEAAA